MRTPAPTAADGSPASPGEAETLPPETAPLPVDPGIPRELADHPRYRVLELLGAGGMGRVYKAEHRIMERLVALKVINRNLIENPAAVERFRREVKTAARLIHPNIVTAFDAEQVEDCHFLVMEFVEGQSLDRVVQTRGRLPFSEACDYVRQAALGLQYAHERGMVHRDIKPQNLMRTPEGQVKILDFGLARFLSEGKPATALTQFGVIMGTPDYIAPEQAHDPRAADIRADIYSLGATFYFLLTGQPPFHETSMAYHKLIHHLGRKPKPIRVLRPDVPEAIAKIVEKMMAKNPWDRYRTPAVVVQALAEHTRTPIPPPPAEEMPKLCPAARRVGSYQPSQTPPPPIPGPSSWVLVNDPRSTATSDTKSPTASAKADTLKESGSTVIPTQPLTNSSTVNFLPPSGASNGSQSRLIRDFLTAESNEPALPFEPNPPSASEQEASRKQK